MEFFAPQQTRNISLLHMCHVFMKTNQKGILFSNLVAAKSKGVGFYSMVPEAGVSESRLSRDAHGLKSMLKYFSRGWVSAFIMFSFFDLKTGHVQGYVIAISYEFFLPISF